MPRRLEITYTRSSIGCSGRQRRTVEALGLRRLHQSVVRDDNPSVRGMIARVHHLVTFRELEEGETS